MVINDSSPVRAFRKGENRSFVEIKASCQLFAAAKFHWIERPKWSFQVSKASRSSVCVQNRTLGLIQERSNYRFPQGRIVDLPTLLSTAVVLQTSEPSDNSTGQDKSLKTCSN